MNGAKKMDHQGKAPVGENHQSILPCSVASAHSHSSTETPVVPSHSLSVHLVTPGAVIVELESRPLIIERFLPISFSSGAVAIFPPSPSSFGKVALAAKVGYTVIIFLEEEEIRNSDLEVEENAGGAAKSWCEVRRCIAGFVDSSASHAIDGRSAPVKMARSSKVRDAIVVEVVVGLGGRDGGEICGGTNCTVTEGDRGVIQVLKTPRAEAANQRFSRASILQASQHKDLAITAALQQINLPAANPMALTRLEELPALVGKLKSEPDDEKGDSSGRMTREGVTDKGTKWTYLRSFWCACENSDTTVELQVGPLHVKLNNTERGCTYTATKDGATVVECSAPRGFMGTQPMALSSGSVEALAQAWRQIALDEGCANPNDVGALLEGMLAMPKLGE